MCFENNAKKYLIDFTIINRKLYIDFFIKKYIEAIKPG